MITINHNRHGAIVDCDCVCQNGIWLKLCSGGDVCETPMGYLKGKRPPNYPVPAIQVRTFNDFMHLGYTLECIRVESCFAEF